MSDMERREEGIPRVMPDLRQFIFLAWCRYCHIFGTPDLPIENPR